MQPARLLDSRYKGQSDVSLRSTFLVGAQKLLWPFAAGAKRPAEGAGAFPPAKRRIGFANILLESQEMHDTSKFSRMQKCKTSAPKIQVPSWCSITTSLFVWLVWESAQGSSTLSACSWRLCFLQGLNNCIKALLTHPLFPCSSKEACGRFRSQSRLSFLGSSSFREIGEGLGSRGVSPFGRTLSGRRVYPCNSDSHADCKLLSYLPSTPPGASLPELHQNSKIEALIAISPFFASTGCFHMLLWCFCKSLCV